jgi:hypothetical protein
MIRYRSRVLTVLLGGFGMTACGSSSPAETPETGKVLKPEATLLHQHYSGFGESQRLVVRDPGTWASVWARAYALQTPVPSLPEVDFSKEMVLVAALGGRPTGGYDIAIEGVLAEAEATRAFVTATAPGRNCVTTQALTQPVVAVRVSAAEGAVEFEERRRTHSCD